MKGMWSLLLMLAWAAGGAAAYAAGSSGRAQVDPGVLGMLLGLGLSAYPAWRLVRIVNRTAPSAEWLAFSTDGETVRTRQAVAGVGVLSLTGITAAHHWAARQLLCAVVDHLRQHPGTQLRANLVYPGQQLPQDLRVVDGVVVDAVHGDSRTALAGYLNAMAEQLLGQRLALPLLEASAQLFPGNPQVVATRLIPNENNCMAAKAHGDTLVELGRVDEGLGWLEVAVARSPVWARAFRQQVLEHRPAASQDARVRFWSELEVDGTRARVLAHSRPDDTKGLPVAGHGARQAPP